MQGYTPPVRCGRFTATYQCFSSGYFGYDDRDMVENGGKIVLPPSALREFVLLGMTYPLLFRIKNAKTSKFTYCGVYKFLAEEGRSYLPSWVMKNIQLVEGDVIIVESVRLPNATFCCFQPESSTFLALTDPKGVLEATLNNYSCLTAGDVFDIHYNNHIYKMLVAKTQPRKSVSIVNRDMKVVIAPARDTQVSSSENQENAGDNSANK